MMGPVEYLVVEFPGNQLKGEIVPAHIELHRAGHHPHHRPAQ